MKKILSWLLMLTMSIAAILTFSLGGCAPAEEVEEEAEEVVEEVEEEADEVVEEVEEEELKKIHMVVIPKVVHEWYDDVERGMIDAIEEFKEEGYEITYDWNPPPTADVSVHVQNLEAAVAKNPDIIAVACLDPDSDATVINEAIDKGINVMTFDADAPGSKRIMFVGHTKEDNYASGAKVADFMVEKIGTDDAEIAFLSGCPTATDHVARMDGIKDILAEKYPNIKVVAEEFDDDDLEKAITLTEGILAAHPNVKGIYCNNASNPIGAGRAVEDAGKAGEIVVVGWAALPELMEQIDRGVVTGTVYFGVYPIGYQMVKHAVAIVNGEEVPDSVAIPDLIVTKDNLDEYERAASSEDGTW